jgi:hypothetical protein
LGFGIAPLDNQSQHNIPLGIVPHNNQSRQNKGLGH